MRNILLLVFIFVSTGIMAQTRCQTTGTGDWTNAATWEDANNPGQPCPCDDGYPGSLNDPEGQTDCPARVNIRAGHDVSLRSKEKIYYNGTLVIYGTLTFNTGNNAEGNASEIIMDSTSSIVIADGAEIQAVGNGPQPDNNFISIGDTRVSGNDINDINDNPKPNQLTEGNLAPGDGGGCSSTNSCDEELIDQIINDPTFDPFPIELIHFEATSEAGIIQLNWTTAKEEEFSHFEIERAIGSQGAWNKIGEVQGAGESVINQYYQFTDKDAPFGQLFYRLKAVDLDGSFEYSWIALYEKGFDGLMNVSPNPTSGKRVKINVPASFDEKIQQIEFFNMSGKRLMLEENVNVYSEINLPAYIPTGMYLMKVTHNGLSEQLKIVIR